jgi:bifunctional Delta-12/omega-3 fatty acid desaturase
LGVYGFVQGLICTGLWILAHECGHGAFSLHQNVNDCIGWAAHSFLLVPYFSWKFSHARHHRFTGHMEKDMAFVPKTKDEYDQKLIIGFLDPEVFDDVPIVNVIRLLGHQLFGWQTYLLFNVTAGPDSLQDKDAPWWQKSHFDPTSGVFRPQERFYVFLSTVGLLIMGSILYWASTILGSGTVFLLYFVPYIWVHHWLSMCNSGRGRGLIQPRAELTWE